MPFKHREERSRYNRAYYKKHTERLTTYAAAYRKEHREDAAEYLRDWKKDNPDYDKEWQSKNRDKKSTNQRKWTKNNPSKVKAMSAKRETRIAKTGGSFTAKEWDALKKKHHNRCLGCRLTEKELKVLGRSLVPDHVIPVARGGTSNISNIQPLCHCGTLGSRGGCNNHKRDSIIDFR